MRELLEIAAWRLKTRGRHPFHPTHVGFWPLAARLRLSKPPASSNGAFTAVLLVHRRPANLDLQIRAALHAASVGEVVVSCNNPEVQLHQWTNVESPRLRLLEEQGRNQTRRYAIALASGGDRFVLPDDDVLLLPDAFDAFCAALPGDGSHVVGLAGQRLLASGLWESAIEGHGEEVDVLNRAYVCTRAHAEEVFRNAEALGWTESETFSNPADDVLVSFAGDACPRVAHVEHVNCVSHTDARISTYRQGGFHTARAAWVAQLRALRNRTPARRDQGSGGAIASTAQSAIAKQAQRRFYLGRSVQTLSLLPKVARAALGIDDPQALRSHRVQIGMQPAPLRSFVRLDDPPDGFADEVVAVGTGTTPELRELRRAMRRGGRLILGVTSQQWASLRPAVDTSGFEVAAVITDGAALEEHPSVSPWKLTGDQDVLLDPVPAALDGSAEVLVVARAR